MKKTEKRAFILSECKSPYIAQAIFILRDGISSGETGVIADAERIVAAYMTGEDSSKAKKNKHSFSVTVAVTAFISVVMSFSIYFFLIK